MMQDFGIYVHWPYCARICPYCDFNVYKAGGPASGQSAKLQSAKLQNEEALVQAIVADLKYWRERSGARSVRSVHFGGGTPSLMAATDIETIIEATHQLWGLNADAEIALEANPTDCNVGKWQGFKSAGINRLSLGVQSFDDQVLKTLGRDHDGASASRALDTAVSMFARVSADLIFGHAGQSAKAWARDLDRAARSGAGHISAYQLTIEPQTAFGRAADRGVNHAVDSEDSAQLYDQTRETLQSLGYQHYEVSNYAQPGQQSRHNLLYWQGCDYAGVGPGAHGRLTLKNERVGTVAYMKPDTYKQEVEQGCGIETEERLSAQEWSQEYLLMGLRIESGISLNRYASLSGEPLSQVCVDDLMAMGLLTVNGDRLAASAEGRLVLDAICRQLLSAQ